ncbi:MAG: DUF4430 domain-containing protein [Candidatus Thorarchaeota archaeon]|nr:MAG: DUF4430 domain-containing protein [Candidatus Thorarchaeota archaeon]
MKRRSLSILPILIGICLTLPAPGTAVLEGTNHLSADGISLTIDFGNETSMSFLDLNATDVLELIQSVTAVDVLWYGDLAYVTGIEGISNSASEGKWWQYWVNDELASVAANKFLLQDGDSVLWSRQDSAVGGNASPDVTMQTDTSLVAGSAIVAVVGLLFLGILYVKGSRSVMAN